MKTKRIETLNDLFLEELGELYNAENQLIKALPRITEAIDSLELRSMVEDQLERTKTQANRLKEIFKELGHEPDHVVCKGMMGIIQEGQQFVRRSEKCPARDAAIIGAAQMVEHYEIAGYGTARSHASMLGHRRVQDLLEETLKEKKEADDHLNGLAEDNINLKAQKEDEDFDERTDQGVE